MTLRKNEGADLPGDEPESMRPPPPDRISAKREPEADSSPLGQPGAEGKPDQGQSPLVWILVLHWQASHYTRACLASLRALTYPNYRILLLDNGSPDQSGGSIARHFPEACLFRLEENLGFAGGCNAGIQYCLERGAEWIWILNNDTKVGLDSLDRLISAAQGNPRAAALGAMVMTGAGEQFVASGPGEIDFRRAKTYLRKEVPGNLPIVDCQWLSGSNLLLRAEAIRQVGGFDEAYFLYFEDTDLCWRLGQSGWRCLLVPAARVEHVGGGSTEGKRTYWRAYYYTRNRLIFFLRYLKGLGRLPALFFIAGHLVRHTLVLPFRGQSGRYQLKAELLGLSDYLGKRLGKASCLDWCEPD